MASPLDLVEPNESEGLLIPDDTDEQPKKSVPRKKASKKRESVSGGLVSVTVEDKASVLEEQDSEQDDLDESSDDDGEDNDDTDNDSDEGSMSGSPSNVSLSKNEDVSSNKFVNVSLEDTEQTVERLESPEDSM
mmetsp:Transcript_571/g.692  ORF Transcript_571/g.692 Transcript_571/m.692 type:complete len:134 (-) Transcript_571:40-441(-)